MTLPLHSRAGLLTHLLEWFGVDRIVICPGSRNAPLINAFSRNPFFRCDSVFDERTAAYYALGIALHTGKPAVVVCTSGTAAVNLYPALTEAYYRHIPLLVITADRPSYLDNTLDGQTIRQQNLYAPHARFSCQLSEDDTELAIRHDARLIADAFHACRYPIPGAAHINAPFSDPLYGTAPANIPNVPGYKKHVRLGVSDAVLDEVATDWLTCERKLIVIGQKSPNPSMDSALDRILQMDDGTVIMGDLTSNLRVDSAITCIDGVLSSFEKDGKPPPLPEMVIYAGNSIISRKLKQWLRCKNIKRNIYVGTTPEPPDVFFTLSDHVVAEPTVFFQSLADKISRHVPGRFQSEWTIRRQRVYKATDAIRKTASFCELTIVGLTLGQLPAGSVVHLGNSLPVRLAHYFDVSRRFEWHANRGTGGIDGCVSTAVGFSRLSARQNILIVGDLSMIYDRNALTVATFPKNLLIVVINNNGGGIFRVIPGASDVAPSVREAFFASTRKTPLRTIEHTARAHQMTYRSVRSASELGHALTTLVSKKRSALIEVFPTVASGKHTFDIFG